MSAPALLVFGILPPGHTACAAATVQASLYFQQQTKAPVTTVISDHAPPPELDGVSPLSFIRERDLKADPARYTGCARLYILDDTPQCLFMAHHLAAVPGAVMGLSNLHGLYRGLLQTQSNWPENYQAWLESHLGKNGASIAAVLQKHRRESTQLWRELDIPSFTSPEKLVPATNQIADMALPFAPAPHSRPAVIRQEYQVPLEAILVVAVGDGCTKDAVQDLTALGKKIHALYLKGSEANLTDLINASDITVITADGTHPPAAMTCALQSGKTLIVAGEWSYRLPDTCAIRLPHKNARHHMVAALGALFKQELRTWYEQGATDWWHKADFGAQQQTAAQTVLRYKAESALPENTAEPPKDPTSTPAKPTSMRDITGQITTIGALPPLKVLRQQFPKVQWENSPRFATPQLAQAVEQETGIPAQLLLPRFGYETPLVISRETPDHLKGIGHTWQNIKAGLKSPMSALSFGCTLEDGDYSLVSRYAYSQDLIFPATALRRGKMATSVQLETSDFLALLKAAEHRVDCMVLTGLAGPFHLTVAPKRRQKSPDGILLVTGCITTGYCNPGTAVVLEATATGLLQFSLGAVDPATRKPLETPDLLALLTNTPLKLVSESGMVTP